MTHNVMFSKAHPGRSIMARWRHCPRIDMRPMLGIRATAAAAILLAGTIVAWAQIAWAQEQSKLPDWSGQWLRGPGMGNGWDPSKEQGHGQQAPLTPEYKAKFDAFLADKAV